MSTLKGRILSVTMVVMAILGLVYLLVPKTEIQEQAVNTGPALPEGCVVIQRMPQALFVRCVVKGNWVYLATLTSRGVTMGQPVRLL